MLNGALARRYAQALFELAVEMSVLDRIDSELRFLAELITQNKELRYLLNHPNIESNEKKKIFEEIFAENVSQISKHFIFLLIDRRRQNLLALIQREFRRLANEKRNLLQVKVMSATTMSPEQQEKLTQAIAKSTGKNIELVAEVRPELIGGAKLQIGDRVMDGSVATALNKFRMELMKASYKPQQEVGVS